jgi:hydroxyacylglutathione hydrolase
VDNMLVLDTRQANAFAAAHVPGAINIGLDGSFAPWVGALISDISQPILLVADPGREAEAVTRLSRVGYDNCQGYLQGGMETWTKAGMPLATVPQVNAQELHSLMKAGPVYLIDVRRKTEYEATHVETAFNLPLDHINEHLELIDKNKYYHVYCAGGYRSMTFISILQARGYHRLIDVQQGFKSLQESGHFSMEGWTQEAAL